MGTSRTTSSAGSACDPARAEAKALFEGVVPRVVIECVRPEVAGGRFPAKRTVRECLLVEADIVADGHDVVAASALFRYAQEPTWRSVPLEPLGNDVYRGSVPLERVGELLFSVRAWVDGYASWLHGLRRKLAAEQATELDFEIGAGLLLEAAERAEGRPRAALEAQAATLRDPALSQSAREAEAGRAQHSQAEVPDLATASDYERVLRVTVDRERAAFSSWYELFPRSCGTPGSHGTLRDVIARLPYIAELGFDVLYMPPIHPIGRTFRKGPNNTLLAGPSDPGSPWAIGSELGGHKSLHPELGSFDDFDELRSEAEKLGIELALDIALQVSPDHPYVREHPEWFRKRPDGSIQYAENPPKRYQDIYPFWFECPDAEALWHELASIFEFWIARGVRMFRVDNPHTKSLVFWEWCIARLRQAHPEVVFLAEAFTRPKLMHALAKRGFSQSYTYFTWRNTPAELHAYADELANSEVAEFFRPNFWPNTPDILPEHLQFGGRATFLARLVLAATLSANYGIYGPAFELMEHVARPGSEEYIDNEKYQLRGWDLGRPDSLRHIIARLNRIRRDQPALQRQRGYRRVATDNEQLYAYLRGNSPKEGLVLVVVNLDPHHRQSGFVHLDPAALGLDEDGAFQMHDLLSDARYLWHGNCGYVELDPATMPAHVMRVRRRLRSEHDFDYFG